MAEGVCLCVQVVHQRSADVEEKKLQAVTRKLQLQPLDDVAEANLFVSDGDVMHFEKPNGGLGAFVVTLSCTHATGREVGEREREREVKRQRLEREGDRERWRERGRGVGREEE